MVHPRSCGLSFLKRLEYQVGWREEQARRHHCRDDQRLRLISFWITVAPSTGATTFPPTNPPTAPMITPHYYP